MYETQVLTQKQLTSMHKKVKGQCSDLNELACRLDRNSASYKIAMEELTVSNTAVEALKKLAYVMYGATL